VLSRLKENGFSWVEDKSFVKAELFNSLKVWYGEADTVRLKLDFVNDTVPRFGEIIETPFYYRVDPIGNILSNKLGAIFRFEGKDIADIREISLHEQFTWDDKISEARHKDAGVEISIISDILESVPDWAYRAVKWRDPVPSWETFKRDLDIIARDMINCRENSLCGK
jgi:hypothetical protein